MLIPRHANLATEIDPLFTWPKTYAGHQHIRIPILTAVRGQSLTLPPPTSVWLSRTRLLGMKVLISPLSPTIRRGSLRRTLPRPIIVGLEKAIVGMIQKQSH